MKIDKEDSIKVTLLRIISETPISSVPIIKKYIQSYKDVYYMSPTHALHMSYDKLDYNTEDSIEFMRQNVQTKFEHYDLNDLTKSSGLQPRDIDKLLPITLKGLSNIIYIYDNNDTNPVNALFLIAVINQDSNNGTDKIATKKNNLFRFRAHGKTPFESALLFKTKSDSIRYFAKLMNSNKYFNNPNYDDTKSIFTVGKLYTWSPRWIASIAENMRMLMSYYKR